MNPKTNYLSLFFILFFCVINNSNATSPLSSQAFHQFNGTRVLHSKMKFLNEKKGNVVFLGGSITHMKGWSGLLETSIKQKFPKANITFLNSGIPSLGSIPHAFRFQQDVLDHVIPDLLFIEAAVNDNSNGYSLIEQKRALEGIIRRTKTLNPKVDIIMMHFAEPKFLKDYAQKQTPTTIKAHNEIAAYYHIPVINLAKEIYARIANNEFEWDRDIKNLHPSPFGQKIYAHSMEVMLETLINHTTIQKPLSDFSSLPQALYKNCYTTAHYEKVKQAKGTFTYFSCYDAKNQSTRKGFTHVPMLIGEHAGLSFSYSFVGKAIGLCVISGNDAGIIEYSIDGAPYQTKDLFTRWSNSLHLPWYIMLDSSLKKKVHTLHLRISEKQNEKSRGNACRIVHFLVN